MQLSCVTTSLGRGEESLHEEGHSRTEEEESDVPEEPSHLDDGEARHSDNESGDDTGSPDALTEKIVDGFDSRCGCHVDVERGNSIRQRLKNRVPTKVPCRER